MTAPLPPDETARLNALHEYAILDTPPEVAFERITRLAAQSFQAPFAFVTLIDEQRHWIKSCYGMEVQENPRDYAFCAYTILQNEALVVPDLQLDERFNEHPLVTQEPYLRFYAGVPLRTAAGFNLGALCILDTVSRQLAASEVAMLTDLAAIVVDELELRLTSIKMLAEIADREQAERELRQTQVDLEERVIVRTEELTQANAALITEINERQQATSALHDAESQYRGIFENAVEGIFQTTPAGHYLSANPALARIYGYTTPDELRQGITDIGQQLYVMPTRRAEFMREMQEHGVVYGFEAEIYRRDGTTVWISENVRLARDAQGNILYYEGMVEDISVRKQAEAALQKAQLELERRVCERTTELAQTNTELRREIVERQRIETAQRQLLAEVEYQRQRLDDTLTNLPGIVWESKILPETQQQQVQFVSEYIETMLGYSREEWLANPDFWLAIMHPEDRAAMSAQPNPTAGAQDKTDEYRVITKDGRVLWVESHLIFHHDDTGVPCVARGVTLDITTRKAAEKALLESEARYRLLADNSLDLIGLLDPQGQVQYASPSHRQVLGYEPAELISHNIFEIMHPDDVPLALAAMQSLFETQQSQSAELRLRKEEGTWLEVEVILSLVTDAAQHGTNQILLSARDITRRKQAEVARRQSEERYSNLFHNHHTIMLLIDPVTQDIVDANPAASHFYGYSQKELLGKKISDLSMLSVAEIDVELQRAQGEARKLLLQHRLVNDDVRDMEIYSGPIEVEGKRLVYAINLDITERKQAEERLRLLESVAVNANDAILITEAGQLDLPGPRILYANAAFTRSTGYSFDEIQGQNPRLLHGPQTERATLDNIRTALEKREPVVAEVLNYRKDGSEFWSQLNIVPVADESGRVTHFVSVQRDITEERWVAASLRRAKEEAERANQAKSEFLSRISHELRTPLNAILGFTQLLAMDERPAQEQENLGYILKAGQHLLSLINEVLDITRIEAGHLSLSLEPVEVREALQEVIALIRPLAQQSGIVLEEPELCDDHVLADRQRLKQVILNLMANAVKYNRTGGQVKLTCEKAAGDRFLISVSDTGLGIAPEKLNQMFTPFDRLGAERTNIEGTGMGLALSKGLVEAMGGSLSVTSVVGQGSVFTIDLPLAHELELPSMALDKAATGVSGMTTATVLYIEDNLPNLHLIERILSQRPGVRLLTALQGSVGLELAREQQPQLILLDLHLPGITGEEILRRLKADVLTKHIPIIVLSADATPDKIQRLYAAGIQAYLTKPLQVQNFLLVLEETLASVA